MKFLQQLGVAILGAVAGALATYWIAFNQTKVQYFTYTVEASDGILENIRAINETAELRINEMRVKNFSLMTFRVYNTANKDYNRVNLKISFDDRDTILSYNYAGANGLKEVEDHGRKEANHRGVYTINVINANRNEEEPVLTATFAISGSRIPRYEIQIDETNLEIKRGSIADLQSDGLFIAIGVTVMLVLAGVIVLFITFYQKKLFEFRLKQVLLESELDVKIMTNKVKEMNEQLQSANGENIKILEMLKEWKSQFGSKEP